MAFTADDEFVLSIVMGLRKGLKLCHGMRRQLTEEEQFRVGREIAAQIKLSNYKVARGEALAGHGGGWTFKPPSEP